MNVTAQGVTDVTDALALASQVTFWIAFAFPVVTALFWKWWQAGAWGWNLILLDLCVVISLLPAPLKAYFGVPYHPLLWYQVGAVLLTGAVLAWRTIIIYLVQRRKQPPVNGDSP